MTEPFFAAARLIQAIERDPVPANVARAAARQLVCPDSQRSRAVRIADASRRIALESAAEAGVLPPKIAIIGSADPARNVTPENPTPNFPYRPAVDTDVARQMANLIGAEIARRGCRLL